MQWNFDLDFLTEDRVHEIDFQVVPNIHASTHTAGSGASRPHAEEFFEDVAERREDVVEIPESREARLLEARVSKAVIKLAFVRVAQYFVRFGCFFKPLFRLFVAGIAIGMELQRLLAVCLLDFVLGGPAVDPKHLIKVSLGHQETRFLVSAAEYIPAPSFIVAI